MLPEDSSKSVEPDSGIRWLTANDNLYTFQLQQLQTTLLLQHYATTTSPQQLQTAQLLRALQQLHTTQ